MAFFFCAEHLCLDLLCLSTTHFVCIAHMNRNLEIGFQRLYYVVWAVYAFFALVATFTDAGFDGPTVEEAIFALVLVFVVPLALMLVFRWIYRGFFPKVVTQTIE